ncbi:MAG TPA: hypothetical protein VFN22_12955 [Gemmatimonadales bacterium]|nr:hypothetical protein [Gemmatimonadales bacterium]
MKSTFLLSAALLIVPGIVAGQQCEHAATYVTAFGTDTISIDHQTFLGDTVTGSLLGRGGPTQWSLIRYRALMERDGLVRSMSLSIWPAAADSIGAPIQVTELTFGPRTMVAVVRDARRGVQSQVDSVVPGTMPYMDNAPFFTAALVRRGLALRADPVDVPMLWLFTRGTREVMTIVRQGADSLMLRTPRMQLSAKVSDGRLLSSWRGDSVAITRVGCG